MTHTQSSGFRTAYDTFILECQVRGYTRATLGFYKDRLRQFIDWGEAHGIAEVAHVTPATVRSYLAHLQDRQLAAHTIHGAARSIRTFLNFCHEEGLIQVAPRFTMPRLPKRVLPAFEPADVQRLLAACLNPRGRCIILFLLDTGVRATELVNLDGRDIDDATGTVMVRQGKGQKDRTVYLGARTRRELLRWWRQVGRPGPHTPVWVNFNTGARLKTNGLRQLFLRLGRRAGVEHCSPHTFRRTFALWSLRSGMNIYTLARLMGHEDITVLRQYLALAEVDLRAAHEQASPVDRMLR